MTHMQKCTENIEIIDNIYSEVKCQSACFYKCVDEVDVIMLLLVKVKKTKRLSCQGDPL